jgi:uncharacterized protein YodC (DUF2158 family)
MNHNEANLGDIVRHKLGGPEMTVTGFDASPGGNVRCQWHGDDGVDDTGVFDPAHLELIRKASVRHGVPGDDG